MKKINELLDTNLDIDIKGIKINSKEIEKGDLFLCTKGVNFDRHEFIDDAIKRGASLIVVSKDVGKKSVPLIYVDDVDKIAPLLFQKFYDHPEKELKIISVGGTDGKTSSATIIQTLLGPDICGYIGTNGYGCSKFHRETNNTTPDSDKLYRYLRELKDSGCEYVVMETSSESYFHKRLEYLSYDGALFTNLTEEHMNIHKTFENYKHCKMMQFKKLKKNVKGVLNSSDKYFTEFKKLCPYLSYGERKTDNLYIKSYELTKNGAMITFFYNKKEYLIESPLEGDFNIYNLCGALLEVSTFIDLESVLPKIKNINIDGRMYHLDMGQDYYVVVDYAHTANGVEHLLKYIKSKYHQKIYTVIGQAGERDPYKRKKVGKITADYSDLAIFTYEDPRSEKVEDIIKMMEEDIVDKTKIKEIPDRKEAIRYAISIAQKGDIVLILGKGNENYEKIGSEVIHFNDVEEAKEAIKLKEKTVK